MATLDLKQGLEPARWQRHLLPGTMVDGPGAGRSLRDWLVDALVTAFSLAIGVLALHSTWRGHGEVARVADIALGLTAVAALWDRRRHPVGVAATVVPISVVSRWPPGRCWSSSSTRRSAATAAPLPGSPAPPRSPRSPTR